MARSADGTHLDEPAGGGHVQADDPGNLVAAAYGIDRGNRCQRHTLAAGGLLQGEADGGGHAGQEVDAAGFFQGEADAESLSDEVGQLSDFADSFEELAAGYCGKFCGCGGHVSGAKVGGHQGRGHIHCNIKLISGLEADDGLADVDALTDIDESLGDDAIKRGFEDAVIKLNGRLKQRASSSRTSASLASIFSERPTRPISRACCDALSSFLATL